MFSLLILISLMALVFISTDRLLNHSCPTGGPGYWAAFWAAMAGLFVISHYFGRPLVLLSLGIILLIYSFLLLGVIPDKNKTLRFLKSRSYWAYGSSVVIMWGISGERGAGVIGAVAVFSVVIPLVVYGLSCRIFPDKNQNVNKLLELFTLLGGIFQFVVVLVVASNRVRFFEKIARYLFL